jgi:4-diphosphocytidyl-2-C-methyl-D-erythritol kinase
VITFPNCKINLGLHVVRKRADGYHDLETVFYPLPMQDIVEVVRSEQPTVQFSTSGITVDGAPSQNLCMKAYDLLKQQFDLPPVQLHLHKTIPAGAGLGGGSANAAFTLRLLNSKFNLGLSTEQLLDLALQLGSDCPFFIINKPCMATGRGEVLEPLELPQLSSYTLVIVNPGIHVATSWAFGQITPGSNGHSIRETVSRPVNTWKDGLVNVFEDPVIKAHPAVGAIKEQLYNKGAVYASMSGSGSTVFGLFTSEPVLEFSENYMVKIISQI